jgi:hypothetical protein
MAIPVTKIVSQWTKSFPFCSISSNEFYQQIEDTIDTHEVPKISIKRVNLKEGSLLSASREYLRVKRNDTVIDICAAPFGKDFFISWWQYETEGILRQILGNTILGNLLRNFKAPKTFYQADEEAMFRGTVHDCVLDVLQGLSKTKGLRALTDIEKAYTTRNS